MKTLKKFAFLSCIGLLLIAFAPSSQANELDKKTLITVSAPVQLPGGKILEPGEYAMREVVLPGTLNVVQITNPEETKVYATVMANSIERMHAGGKPVVTMREAPLGEASPLNTWFYPGRTDGWEFPPTAR